MPLIPNFVETFEKAIKIHKLKNDDYCPPDKPFFNFDVQEYLSNLFNKTRDKIYITMIAIKIARLSVLLNKEGAPNNESIEDSFDDLIVYAGIWKCDYLNRKNKNEMPLL